MAKRSKRAMLGRFALLSFVCLSSNFVGAQLCRADEDANLARGLENYHKQQFLPAIRDLDLVCARDPRHSVAHYYLANCFLKIDDKQRAIEEYKLALNFSRDAKIVEYCRRALLTLCSADSRFEHGLERPVLAGTTIKVPLPQTFDERHGNDALRRISQQAEAERNRLEHKKILVTSHASQRFIADAQKLRKEGEIVEQNMKSDVTIRPVVDGVNKRVVRYEFPNYTNEQIADKKAWYENEAKRIEARGKQHAANISESLVRQQRGLHESAESLRSQLMRTPSLADSTAIEPLGTNLFVRNYQPISRLLENIPPVHPARAYTESVHPQSANADSLGPSRRATADSSSPGLSADAASAKAGIPTIEKKVHGKLMK
jgi:hypothetical protein